MNTEKLKPPSISEMRLPLRFNPRLPNPRVFKWHASRLSLLQDVRNTRNLPHKTHFDPLAKWKELLIVSGHLQETTHG